MAEICRENGISQNTLYVWKHPVLGIFEKYSGVQTDDLKRLRDLERENSQTGDQDDKLCATSESARYCLTVSRAKFWIKGSSRLQDARADRHKRPLTGHNHRLLVFSFSHQPIVKGLEDGAVTNRGQCRKKQLRPGVSATFPTV